MMHNGKGRNYSEGQGNNGSTELLCRIKSSLPGIPFFKSEAGVKYFGKETAAALAKAADEAKEKGSKYCICPACTAGGYLLDHIHEL